MLGAKEAAVDDGGMGDTLGTAALDDDSWICGKRAPRDRRERRFIKLQDQIKLARRLGCRGKSGSRSERHLQKGRSGNLQLDSIRQRKYCDEIQEYSRSPSLDFVPAPKSGLTITDEAQMIDLGEPCRVMSLQKHPDDEKSTDIRRRTP